MLCRTLCWASIFIFKLRFPPSYSILFNEMRFNPPLAKHPHNPIPIILYEPKHVNINFECNRFGASFLLILLFFNVSFKLKCSLYAKDYGKILLLNISSGCNSGQ